MEVSRDELVESGRKYQICFGKPLPETRTIRIRNGHYRRRVNSNIKMSQVDFSTLSVKDFFCEKGFLENCLAEDEDHSDLGYNRGKFSGGNNQHGGKSSRNSQLKENEDKNRQEEPNFHHSPSFQKSLQNFESRNFSAQESELDRLSQTLSKHQSEAGELDSTMGDTGDDRRRIEIDAKPSKLVLQIKHLLNLTLKDHFEDFFIVAVLDDATVEQCTEDPRFRTSMQRADKLKGGFICVFNKQLTFGLNSEVKRLRLYILRSVEFVQDKTLGDSFWARNDFGFAEFDCSRLSNICTMQDWVCLPLIVKGIPIPGEICVRFYSLPDGFGPDIPFSQPGFESGLIKADCREKNGAKEYLVRINPSLQTPSGDGGDDEGITMRISSRVLPSGAGVTRSQSKPVSDVSVDEEYLKIKTAINT